MVGRIQGPDAVGGMQRTSVLVGRDKRRGPREKRKGKAEEKQEKQEATLCLKLLDRDPKALHPLALPSDSDDLSHCTITDPPLFRLSSHSLQLNLSLSLSLQPTVQNSSIVCPCSQPPLLPPELKSV